MNSDYPALLIAFEGMDCSFKETNSKKLKEFLTQKYPDKNVYLYSFPNYNSESSYFIKQWLNGNWSDYLNSNNIVNKAISVSTLYTLDRVDTFIKEDIWSKLKDKNSIIIFDRYIMSNLYYQLADMWNLITESNEYTEAEYKQILWFIYASETITFEMPTEDITIFMNSPINLILNKIREKANKDNNEKNEDFLCKTYFNIKNILKYIRTKDITFSDLKNIDNIYEIKTSDDNVNFLSEDELFNKVLDTIQPAIDKHFGRV